MSQQAWLRGDDKCPQCKGREFKLRRTSFSVAYYMPVAGENRVCCVNCNWLCPSEDVLELSEVSG